MNKYSQRKKSIIHIIIQFTYDTKDFGHKHAISL